MEHLIDISTDKAVLWTSIVYGLINVHIKEKGNHPTKVFIDIKFMRSVQEHMYNQHQYNTALGIKMFNAQVYFALDLGNKIVTV